MKNSLELKLSRDVNGNKTIKIKREGFTGFSIQTLQNLPHTHRRGMKDRLTDYDYFVMITEISDYIAKFGTVKQKSLIVGV